jgi:hypothetical protein
LLFAVCCLLFAVCFLLFAFDSIFAIRQLTCLIFVCQATPGSSFAAPATGAPSSAGYCVCVCVCVCTPGAHFPGMLAFTHILVCRRLLCVCVRVCVCVCVCVYVCMCVCECVCACLCSCACVQVCL